MQNAEEAHLKDTGISQEQLMRYMSQTLQFKKPSHKKAPQ